MIILHEGEIFGNWTIVKYDKSILNLRYYMCKCKCGKIISVRACTLKNGQSKQCRDCANKSNRLKFIKGQVFGNWTIIKETEVASKFRHYKCKCKCGQIKAIASVELKIGRSTQCRDCAAKSRIPKVTTHGRTKTIEYSRWHGMRERCEKPNHVSFRYYGGRGIKVCERWLKFENFFEDMGLIPDKKYQIDRINTNGDYEPVNCRWATCTENNNNKRNSKKNKV